MAALLAAGAGLAADAFREPRIEDILYALAIGTAFECATNIGVVDLVKRFQFNRQFVYLIGPKLTAVIVTIVLAFTWRSYWALVAGILSSKLVKVVLSYVMVRYRPTFSTARAHQLIHFSKWLLLNNVCVFLNLQVDTFIIGRMLGAQPLGLFNVTKEVAMLPTTELVWPLSQVILPTFANIGHDLAQLARGYLEATAVIWLVGAPAGVGIALVADLAVPVFLGNQWLDAIPLMQVLAVSGAFRVLYSMSGNVFLVVGRPFLIAVLAAVTVAMTIPGLYVGIRALGLLGATYAVFAITLVSLAINAVLVMGTLRLSVGQLAAGLWRPALAVLAMAAVLMLLRAGLDAPASLGGQVVHLVLFMLVGGAAYIFCELGLWWLSGRPSGAETRLLDFLHVRALAHRT
jgi:O-antigen/teichoic acid export membrane protein